ncbi:hypothetical protein PUR61_38670 [Streptomyces sp. BE20]|uniref:hypothetical protein n=1 Tax=Streptomyces sp. BE20 TaxID=3002525 RepID=UPI002E795000|nr:hypothetical protein [Streptomyces sp. BE20]MEE1828061.1 hypothetical protein [Streptomyces sp. BE20]
MTDRGRRCTVDMKPVEGSAYDSPTGLTVAWPANRVRAAGTTLATATPVEIDIALAALDSRYRKARHRLDLAVEVLHAAVGDRRTGSTSRGPWRMSDAQALEAARRSDRTDHAFPPGLDVHAAASTELRRIAQEQAPYLAEWKRRGGWSRTFLAQPDRGTGHAHRSEHCSTCHNGPQRTRLAWLTAYSGATDEQIVRDAGERACTVCFPDAPVDVLRRPSRMTSRSEAAARKGRQDRELEKAARAATKAAKAIANPDGTPLRVTGRGRTETIETTHAARMWLADTFESWRPAPDDSAIQQVAAAIAHKEGKTPEEAIEEAKTRTRRRK